MSSPTDASLSSSSEFIHTPSCIPSSRVFSSPRPPPPITSAPTAGVYTPAELLLLATSPLAKLSAEHVDAMRVHVPEVLQTRKQRKTLAMAWHARYPTTSSAIHQRTLSGSHGHASSESEEDRASTWRIR